MAKSNSIATSFTGQNQSLVNSIQQANQALAGHSGQLRRTRRDFRQFTQNAIFGMEDVMSVIGTSGLSGAVRAASNNITMMAMALGGTYGMAAGVAISTTAQLILMFSQAEDQTKKMREEYDAWKETVRDTIKYGTEQTQMTQKLRKVQNPSEYKALIQAEQDRVELLKANINRLGDLRRAELAARDAAKARYNAVPSSGSSFVAGDPLGGGAEGWTKLDSSAYNEMVAAEEKIKTVKEEQIRLNKELHQAEINLARLKHESSKAAADQQQRYNDLIRSGTAGTKAFAESIAKHGGLFGEPGKVEEEFKKRQSRFSERGKRSANELNPLWDVYNMEQRHNSQRRMMKEFGTRDPVATGLNQAGIGSFRDFMGVHGTPEDPEQASKLRQYQMQMRDKSPEFHGIMEDVYKRRQDLQMKREATKEEKETASNTSQATELLQALVDRMPEFTEGAFT